MGGRDFNRRSLGLGEVGSAESEHPLSGLEVTVPRRNGSSSPSPTRRFTVRAGSRVRRTRRRRPGRLKGKPGRHGGGTPSRRASACRSTIPRGTFGGGNLKWTCRGRSVTVYTVGGIRVRGYHDPSPDRCRARATATTRTVTARAERLMLDVVLSQALPELTDMSQALTGPHWYNHRLSQSSLTAH
jgi:hypothetical protein